MFSITKKVVIYQLQILSLLNQPFQQILIYQHIFGEPKSFGRSVKVQLDLSNYATKVDLKNATGVDRSKFAKTVDLASLKSEVDKLDIDKLGKYQLV